MSGFDKGNMSSVIKKGNLIYRTKPTNYRTQKRFFDFMQDFKINMPNYVGETADEMLLTFVEGESIHQQMEAISFGDKEIMIQTAAQLLAEFHSATANFPVVEEDEFFLEYKGELKKEVICHNDFAPYNLTFNGFQAIGLIDFDTICPAPREWDIAYALYRFILIDKKIETAYDYLITLFLTAYDYRQSTNFYPIVVERLESLIALFDSEIAKGNQVFIDMEENGHKTFYIEEVRRINCVGLKKEVD